MLKARIFLKVIFIFAGLFFIEMKIYFMNHKSSSKKIPLHEMVHSDKLFDQPVTKQTQRLREDGKLAETFSDTNTTVKPFIETTSGKIRICSQEERRNYLAEQCEKLPTYMRNKTGVRLDRLLVDHEHKLIYCVIPKAACTTWKGIMANSTSAGYTLRGTKIHWRYPHMVFSKHYLSKVGLDYIRSDMVKLWNSTLQHYTKFLVVRDPMQRILSAYYDKLRDDTPLLPFLRVMREYFNRTDTVPFSDFVHFLTDPGYHLQYNIHWKSYNRLCSPCNIQYDYILRLETMEYDQNHILPLLRMNTKRPLPKLNLSPNSNIMDTNHKQDHLDEYWSVEESQLRDLLQRYYIDRTIFGYQYNMATRRSYCSIRAKNGDTCC